MRRSRPRRVDANHAIIRGMFLNAGLSVLDVSQAPCGCDLVVGSKLRTAIVEVKDGSLPPSKRRLKPNEQEVKDKWLGTYAVVETEEQANDLIAWLKGN